MNKKGEQNFMKYIDMFFDETGKNKKEISLMGGISLPHTYYMSKRINDLNIKLRNEKLHFHFTKYTKNDLDKYMELLSTFLFICDAIQINIITYKLSMLKDHVSFKSESESMIYERIPERVLYGLLRNYSNLETIYARIYIENSSQYKKLHLDKYIKRRINVHSLYRYDNFKVIDSQLVSKNQEIGVEFTDTMLGIIRLIMFPPNLIKNNGEVSQNMLSKIVFINAAMNILEPLLKRVRVFELTKQDHLTQIDFETYISFFKSYFNYFSEKLPEEFNNCDIK